MNTRSSISTSNAEQVSKNLKGKEIEVFNESKGKVVSRGVKYELEELKVMYAVENKKCA